MHCLHDNIIFYLIFQTLQVLKQQALYNIKMHQEIIYHQIKKQQNCSLSIGKVGNLLKLKLNIKKTKLMTETYSIEISQLKQIGIDENYFENQEQFLHYIKDPKNIVFDFSVEDSPIIKVVGVNPVKKDRVIIIGKIVFSRKQTVSVYKQLELISEVLRLAHKKGGLQQEQMKQMFQNLAISLQKLFLISIQNSHKIQQNAIKSEQDTQKSYQYKQDLNEQVNPPVSQEILSSKSLIQKQIQQKIAEEIQKRVTQMQKQIYSQLLIQIQRKINEFQNKLQQFIINSGINSTDFQSQQTQKFLFSSQSSSPNRISKINNLKVLSNQQIEQKLMKSIDKQFKNPQKDHKLKKIFNQPKVIMAKSWIDPEYASQNNLIFQQNKITVKSKSFIRAKPFLQNKTHFSVYINKIKRSFFIGILGIKQNKKELLKNQENEQTFKFLYSNDKKCRNYDIYQKKVGLGYRQCQNITVNLNTLNGSIQWIAKGEIRFKLLSEILIDKEIKWVPYIGFGNQSDSVTIVE